MIQYQFFPRSRGVVQEIKEVIDCFEAVSASIDSAKHSLTSNKVLEKLAPGLVKLGYKVEVSKKRDGKITVPVLFGMDNAIDKSFNADAVSRDGRIVIEVEAGRALESNQYMKDIFQACMMFDVEYLIIAVRHTYRKHPDFERIKTFLETLYISNRLHLPLKGILLIGY